MMKIQRHLLQTAAPIGLAAMLLGVTPAYAEPLVYIPLGEENQILTIDAETDTEVGRIAGTEAVHGLAGTPDGRLLVAGSLAARPAGNAPEKPTGVSEEDHAAHHGMSNDSAEAPSGPLVSTVSIIDRESGDILRRIDVPGAVHHVAVSPDSRFAAVTLINADAVSVIGLEDFELITTVKTGSTPNYAVFGVDTEALFVGNAGGGTVSRIAVDGWTPGLQAEIGDSPGHLVMSEDGSTLYVANEGNGKVTEIDPKKMAVLRNFEMGGTLHGLDLSENGRTLFAAVRETDQIGRIDLDTGDVSFVNLAPGPYHLMVVDGTGKVYVSSAEESKIWVLDADDLSLVGEIGFQGTGHQMVVVPGS
tara:strand:- start:2908 stop:3990 length:1083 start_codon:yes stop_codon:yes gene_type:complete